MGPSRTTTVKSKHAANKSGIKNSRANNKTQNDGISKSKPPKSKAPPLRSSQKGPPAKKKRRVYTEKELGIPALNMITPVGVEKPKGKKKGKVFVEDRESMMTILAMVNADKEGQIESKMMKARQMEEIREARKAEAAKKAELKKLKLEEKKESMRKKRKRTSTTDEALAAASAATSGKTKKTKSVSFA